MLIPISNAIFDNDIEIQKFLYSNQFKFEKDIKNLSFEKVDSNKFPSINLIKEINKNPSTAIIVNASNEVLVNHFLQKKIHFLDIYNIIMGILNDSNFRKYAIRKPINIKQIYQIDNWARTLTKTKI